MQKSTVLARFTVLFVIVSYEGFCKAEGPTSSHVNCSDVITIDGKTESQCCVFPFWYQDTLHYSCIPSSSGGVSWCATTANYDDDHKKMDCPQGGGEGENGGGGTLEGKCSHFPSGLAALLGGPLYADHRWSLQCPSSQAITSFWDDVNRFTILRDVKCCSVPVFHNISHVISNLTSKVGGSSQPATKWEAQCFDNYVVTGLHSPSASSEAPQQFRSLDGIKCSLLIGHRVNYNSCSVINLPDKPEGKRDPATRWKTECPKEHLITALYSDNSFTGVKKIKCCPFLGVANHQRLCTLEDGMCHTWSSSSEEDGFMWSLGNGTELQLKDHTIGSQTGHLLYMESTHSAPNSHARLKSIGLPSSWESCLAVWYHISEGSAAKITVSALIYDEELQAIRPDALSDAEEGGHGLWTEQQIVLPADTNYQLIIDGMVNGGGRSWIALDDIQFKPKKFCTGVCSSIGPLQGSASIHDGQIILWQASCLDLGNGDVTGAITGLWDKHGSHFRVIEYVKCCNMPLLSAQSFYKMSLAGKEGGPMSADFTWNAQCKRDYVLTGLYSLNKFNGLYELGCGALSEARVNYSKCGVIWSEVRNHAGVAIRQHVECAHGMVSVGLFDHPSDNNNTAMGFSDIDAMKCCHVEVSNCYVPADCHRNADCVNTNAINRCICRQGYYGNGKYCRQTSALEPTITSHTVATTPDITHAIHQHLTEEITGSNEKNLPTEARIAGSPKTTAVFIAMRATDTDERRSVVMVALSVTAAGLVIFVILVVVVWSATRWKKTRRRVRNRKEAEMTPMNEMRSLEMQRRNEGDMETSNANQLTDDEKVPVFSKPRSDTVLSVEHAYVAEEDLDSSPVIRESFYFVLDKNTEKAQKTYSICSSLALPEPMYGVLEPETSVISEGAQFWQPANNEEELYHQLSREIHTDNLEVGEERLGSGAFGHVLLGVWQKSPGIPVQVAIKMLRNSSATEDKIKFLQEAAIMRQFSHKNVVFMYGVVTSRDPIMIVLEYMSRGNLKNYLRHLRAKYGDTVALQHETLSLFLRMARDIAAGMQYLHSLAFVHRDLAGRNILLDSDMNCKIGDFGLSRDLVQNYYYTSRGGRIPVKWTAPEAINYGKYSSASDVWSYGIVLYEIWSLGLKPYANLDNNEVIEAVSRGYRLPPPVHCPQMLYRLMVDCWHPESQFRPRSSQIHHCLCFSDQRIFLDKPIGSKDRSYSESAVLDVSSYVDLKYVYAVTE